MSMRIAVFGTGGVGGYFGARLAAAGEDVRFIARGRHLDAIRGQGLHVRSALGDVAIRPRQATDDPAAVGPVDLVLVTVKLYDTEATVAASRPLVGPATTLLSLQNGVEAVDTLRRTFGRERVLGGCTYILATIAEPGVIAHTGTMARLVFGELDGRASERTEALCAACDRAGIDATVSDDIVGAIWTKFTFLAAVSGITALTRLPLGPIRSDSEARALVRAAIDEAVAVARARGIILADDTADRHMATISGLPAEMGSSMLYDLSHRRRLELAWLSGAVVRMGQELSVPTPVHRTVFAALHPYAEGEIQQ